MQSTYFRQHPFVFILLLTFICLSGLLYALTHGSMSISLSQVIAALFNETSDTSAAIVNDLRLPRALTAFAVGAMLALAGALMQVLVRNPLADPYVLGISGGASTAALLAMVMGITHVIGISGFAMAGAIFSMLLVFIIAHGTGHWSSQRLLLTGIVIAAGWGALISLILALSPQSSIHGLLFWLMGDLSHAPAPGLALLMCLIGLLLSMLLSRQLNVLVYGQELAAALGVNTHSLHLYLYLVSSLLTASAVVQGGSVGFVGLVMPHLVRMAGITDHRFMLPAAALGGGALVILADTLARTIIAPQQLPVGIITALIGIPLFLFLLQKQNRQ